MTLALHHITAIETTPLELVNLAAAIGCEAVCVFVHLPSQGDGGAAIGGLPRFHPVTAELAPAFRQRCAERGVGVMNVEYFPIESGTDVGGFRDPVALAARIGARRLVAHVHDTDRSRALDTLRALCDLAGEHGLGVGLEFMPLSPGCTSLAEADAFVTEARRDNLGIAIDALHWTRTGGSAADVARIDPGHIAYVQLCDGPRDDPGRDYLAQAFDRLVPGEGGFALRELLASLPQSVDLDVEVPSTSGIAQGRTPLDRARRAVTASRALLAEARQAQT